VQDANQSFDNASRAEYANQEDYAENSCSTDSSVQLLPVSRLLCRNCSVWIAASLH